MRMSAPAIIFVLGGPGSGKGTQCARLSQKYGYAQIGMGDLLRAEATAGTERGTLVADIIARGAIVPAEITMKLLREAMKTWGARTVLLDGFPRTLSQAMLFEKSVAPCTFALYFHCDVEEMRKRLLVRGETSGRVDDNDAVITKRFDTFVKQTMPVVDYYRGDGKLKQIDATVGGPDEVFKLTRAIFEGASY